MTGAVPLSTARRGVLRLKNTQKIILLDSTTKEKNLTTSVGSDTAEVGGVLSTVPAQSASSFQEGLSRVLTAGAREELATAGNDIPATEGNMINREASVASTLILSDHQDTSNYKDNIEKVEIVSSETHKRAISEPIKERAPIDELLGDHQHTDNQRDCPVEKETQQEVITCLVDPRDLLAESHTQDDDSNMVMDVDMMETFSVTESTKILIGKRRRCKDPSDSEKEESEEGIGHRLRSRKARIIDTTLEEEPTSQKDAFSSCIATTSTEVGESTMVETDPELTNKKGKDKVKKNEKQEKGKEKEEKKDKRRKQNKRRLSPIGDKLHPMTGDDQLSEYPTASLVTLAMGWVEDVDLIRVRSLLQGVLSKHVKERLKLIKRSFQILHDQFLGMNDPGQLKLRNARLAANYHAAQQEIQQLKRENEKLKEKEKEYKEVKNKTEIPTLSHKEVYDRGTSPIRSPEHISKTDGMEEEINKIKDRIMQLENSAYQTTIKTDVSLVDKPLPQRQPRAKPIIKNITELDPTKKIIIKAKRNTTHLPAYLPETSGGPDVHGDSGLDSGPGCDGPVDPAVPGSSGVSSGPWSLSVEKFETKKKDKVKFKVKSGDETDGHTSKDEETAQWKKVIRRKKRYKKKMETDSDTQSGKEEKGKVYTNSKIKVRSVPKKAPKEKTAIQILQKRVPKASAVIIKGKDCAFSYADALVRLRKEIPLEEIGINNTRIKKTSGGAVLIEVPGADNKKLAEELRSRAAQVLGDMATVTRPEIRGEMRIIGFDESVSIAEIANSIAKVGECQSTEIIVTPIVPMRNGLCMTWVRCPIAAAVKASKKGKVHLG